ncbi:MAG: acyltransferase [Spirulinaceae cyanobacterium]
MQIASSLSRPKNHFSYQLAKLDALRGFASIYIVLHHLVANFVNSTKGTSSLLKTLKLVFSFGQEFVIIFFLISGCVIYLSTIRNSQINFSTYFFKRFRRIYPPVVVAILLSILIVILNGKIARGIDLRQLMGNLLMLQDTGFTKPGVWCEPFVNNYPLWSLSYQWWFYMLFFPLYKILPQRNYRIYFILFISGSAWLSYLARPNYLFLVFTYFIIWWSGLETAAVFMRNGSLSLSKMKHIFICLGIMCLFTFLPLLQAEKISFGIYPFLMFRHFFASLLLLAIALFWYQRGMIFFQETLGHFAILAPISYGIYLFHYPILISWNTSPWSPNILLSLGIKLFCVVGLAYLVEQKIQPSIREFFQPKKLPVG